MTVVSVDIGCPFKRCYGRQTRRQMKSTVPWMGRNSFLTPPMDFCCFNKDNLDGWQLNNLFSLLLSTYHTNGFQYTLQITWMGRNGLPTPPISRHLRILTRRLFLPRERIMTGWVHKMCIINLLVHQDRVSSEKVKVSKKKTQKTIKLPLG